MVVRVRLVVLKCWEGWVLYEGEMKKEKVKRKRNKRGVPGGREGRSG